MPETILTEATLAPFETSLRGELLRPESDGYDDSRGLWNAMIHEHPWLIARCAGVGTTSRDSPAWTTAS